MSAKPFALLVAFLSALGGPSLAQESVSDDLVPLLADLESAGREPLAFVLERLTQVDLVLFDDGLHSAVEPYRFLVISDFPAGLCRIRCSERRQAGSST